MIRIVSLVMLSSILLAGCLGVSVPTPQRPSCSWDSTVPPNAGRVCRNVYSTLNAVAHAEETGDNATMRRLISSHPVRRRIMAHGRTLRSQQVQNLHVVPSFTLDQLHPHIVGAGFYLNGNIRGGRVNAPQTIELRVTRTRAVIVNDQPGQEW